jgi:Amt family ammonium transporter
MHVNVLRLLNLRLSLILPPAGQLNWYDPDSGTTVVYNGGPYLLPTCIGCNSNIHPSGGDIAWTLASTALVWIMIPGVGFFYSGLLRRKNALSMIYLSMMCVAVVSFEV